MRSSNKETINTPPADHLTPDRNFRMCLKYNNILDSMQTSSDVTFLSAFAK